MYYIYGHFLDGKCIYIGSNCMNMNNSRAYDLSDRNKEYAKLTKNKKDEIKKGSGYMFDKINSKVIIERPHWTRWCREINFSKLLNE